jgi:hypothetical protein
MVISDLERTLTDLETVAASGLRPPPPDQSRSSQRSASVWRRVQNAVVAEFALARCEERLTHILKILIVCVFIFFAHAFALTLFQARGVIPPLYDDPATQVPDRVQLRMWDRSQPIDQIVQAFYHRP